MAVRQVTTPNINIPAQSGWCLKYVDDTTKAPSRQAYAAAAFRVEQANGNIRTTDFPVGVWVPGFLGLTGQADGHVFLAYNHGDGNLEIHDSEVHSGKRQPYHSLAELFSWFRKYGPSFIGWSYWCDGTQYVEDYTPPQPPAGQNLHLPADVQTWRVYNVAGPYTIGHEIAMLKPAKFGGLDYPINRWIVPGSIAEITTQDFGAVAIYVAPSTEAVIS